MIERRIKSVLTNTKQTPEDHCKVALLGSTGRAGKWLVEELLDSGFDVRVLVRDPATVSHLKNRVEIVHGDGANYRYVEETMEGCLAVLSTLGPTGLNRRAAKELICSQVTSNVIKAASRLNIKRYVVVSGAAVSLPQDRRN